MKGMLKYAFKNWKIKENYLRKYRDGNSGRKAYEASRSDSLLRRKKEEVDKLSEPITQPNEYRSEYSSLLLTEEVKHEIIREENASEAHQEGRQRVQESDQGRCEVEETNIIEGEKMKKEKKHEAKETKAYEKKEEKKELKKVKK